MARELPKHRAREYETIFILDPETTSEVTEQVAGRLTEIVDKLEGKLLHAENWGRRRLAYPVKKHAKGVYIYFRYLGYSGMVHEIERNLRMLEPVLKYLTVKIEEDVDPAARPVNAEDICFLPEFEEDHARPQPEAEEAEPEAAKDEPEAAKDEPEAAKDEPEAEEAKPADDAEEE